MSRRQTLLDLVAEITHHGITKEQLAPFLAALPDDQVAIKRGRRVYSPLQIAAAIKVCAAAKKIPRGPLESCSHPPGEHCDLCAMGQLRSTP